MILALVMLTALDGSPVWIESEFVQVIRPAQKQCHTTHGGVIRVGGYVLCVKETPEEIEQKMRELPAKDHK